jgi:hypothetical protein
MQDLLTMLELGTAQSFLRAAYSALVLVVACAVAIFFWRSAYGQERIGVLSSSRPGKGTLICILAIFGLSGAAFECMRSLFRHTNRILRQTPIDPIPSEWAFAVSLVAAVLMGISLVVLVDRYSVLRVQQAISRQIDRYTEELFLARTADDLKRVLTRLEAEMELARKENEEIAHRYGPAYRGYPAKNTCSAAEIKFQTLRRLLNRGSVTLATFEKIEAFHTKQR